MPTRKSGIWLSTIAAVVFVGGIANACSPDTNPPSQPVGNIDTVTVTTTDSPTTTTIAPLPVTEAPVTEAPVTEAPATEVPAVQAPATQAPAPVDTQPACGSDSYLNSDGQCVPDPVAANSPPPGATAKCNDGTYSFSKHHSGTCSHHGGVAEWLS